MKYRCRDCGSEKFRAEVVEHYSILFQIDRDFDGNDSIEIVAYDCPLIREEEVEIYCSRCGRRWDEDDDCEVDKNESELAEEVLHSLREKEE